MAASHIAACCDLDVHTLCPPPHFTRFKHVSRAREGEAIGFEPSLALFFGSRSRWRVMPPDAYRCIIEMRVIVGGVKDCTMTPMVFDESNYVRQCFHIVGTH